MAPSPSNDLASRTASLFVGSGEGRWSARGLLANGSESKKSLGHRDRRVQPIVYRATGENRERGQRGRRRALRIGASGIAVGTLMMRGSPRVMMVVVVFARRHLRIAQDDCESAVDRRQHEPCRNEGAQRQHSKHEHCCPAWIPAGRPPLVHTMHQSPTRPNRRYTTIGSAANTPSELDGL